MHGIPPDLDHGIGPLAVLSTSTRLRPKDRPAHAPATLDESLLLKLVSIESDPAH